MREGRGVGEGVSELLVRVGQGLGCRGTWAFMECDGAPLKSLTEEPHGQP